MVNLVVCSQAMAQTIAIRQEGTLAFSKIIGASPSLVLPIILINKILLLRICWGLQAVVVTAAASEGLQAARAEIVARAAIGAVVVVGILVALAASPISW